LPWEQKAALGILAVLSLQAFHEGVLWCLRSDRLGYATLEVFSPLLLAACLGIGLGLLKRRRAAWWCGVTLLCVLAILHLVGYWKILHRSFEQDPLRRIPNGYEYEWFLWPTLSPFGLFWVLSRQVFLTACPALLALGALRTSLRRD
jgi:hypothetical protein